MPSPADTPAVRVVAAVIEAGGQVLVTRRLHGTHLEGLWEFPGGKVDEGESHAAALAREIREELDAGIDIGPLVFETAHTYAAGGAEPAQPLRRVHLFFYRCRLTTAVRAMLGQEMRWVPRADLATLRFPEADLELIEFLSTDPGPGNRGHEPD